MDDFSIDRTRKLWASATDPGVTLDETIYALEVDGVSEFDMTFATDTTFYYTIDTQDPPVTTRIALPSFEVTVRDLEGIPRQRKLTGGRHFGMQHIGRSTEHMCSR